MKNTLALLLVIVSLSIGKSQNTSFGLNLSAFDHVNDDETGLGIGADLRVDFSKILAIKIGVDYLKSDTKKITSRVNNQGTIINTEEYNNTYLSWHTNLILKIFNFNGLACDLSAGIGLVKDRKKIWLLYRNELYLSTQLSKHISVGIPIGFNVITWERDIYNTIGISLRYHP